MEQWQEALMAALQRLQAETKLAGAEGAAEAWMASA